MVLDPKGVPIIYQQNETGEIVKIEDTKAEIIKKYPMLVGDKEKEQLKANELLDASNTHVIGNFNACIYKPSKEKIQGYFFMNDDDIENLKVQYEEHTFAKFKKLDKEKRYKHLAILMPKVQRLNDDSSKRVMIAVRHSQKGAAQASLLNSFTKGTANEVFIIVFDLATDKVVYQHQIKNELTSDKLSRYNLQLYLTIEQSSEANVTQD